MAEIEEDTQAAYPPLERFNKEQNYVEFERTHGFDIRGTLTVLRSSVRDTRDNRDPQAIGSALLSRPENVSILEMADLIGELQ